MTADLLAARVTRPALPLAVASVALQIAYPLASGAARDALTILVVVTLSGAAFAHAAQTRGTAALSALAAVTVLGLLVEALALRTGVPFGRYDYTGALGPRLLGVPVVVALAWTMLAWPAAVVARHLVRSYPARVVVGAWALAAGDLFLDPQQVAAGYWRWATPAPHLPGVPSVPLTNYAGWLVVSLAVSALLQRVVAEPADDRVALGLYLWLWAGWTIALAVFLDLRAAAAWGALGMGAVAVPLARRLLPPRSRADTPSDTRRVCTRSPGGTRRGP